MVWVVPVVVSEEGDLKARLVEGLDRGRLTRSEASDEAHSAQLVALSQMRLSA